MTAEQEVQKILLHNLTISYSQPSAGIFNFDQNAVFFSENNDIVVTRKKIPQGYLAFLKECGISIERVHFVVSGERLHSDRQSIFLDQDIIRQVTSLIQTHGTALLDSFILTDLEVQWANNLGIQSVGDPKQLIFGGKSAFRSLAKKHHFPIASGFEYQKDAIAIMTKASLLYLRGFDEVVVKHDEGVAANGSRRFRRDELFVKFSAYSQFVSDQHQLGVVPQFGQSFVVEGWENNVLYSPSVQIWIAPSGAIELLSLHIQLFGADKMRYQGCLSSQFLESDVEKELREKGVALAKVFAGLGYRGHMGFNAIVLEDKRIVWEELNPRRVMSSYPFQIRKRLYGAAADKVSYMSKHIRKPKWKGKTIEDVLTLLAPVLFSQSLGKGVLPFDYGLLESFGQLTLVAFSPDKEEVKELFEYAENL